jgi:hypothetical protein
MDSLILRSPLTGILVLADSGKTVSIQGGGAAWLRYVVQFLSPLVPACMESHMRPDLDQDRADVEQVFNKYLQSLNAADVALASKVWLQSPDVQVVTPLGRFKGWDGVQEIPQC